MAPLRAAGALLALACLLPAPAQAQTPTVCPLAAPAPQAAWTLEVALTRIDCHPQVRLIPAQLDAARADVRTAGQTPNPALTVGLNALQRGGIGGGRFFDKTFDHQLRVDQLVEGGQKRDKRLAQAAAMERAARAEAAVVRQLAQVDIASAYVDLWAVQKRSVLVEGQVDLAAQSLNLLEARVKAGDAPALDAERARAEWVRLRSELSALHGDLAAAGRRFQLVVAAAAPMGAAWLLEPPAVAAAEPTAWSAEADAVVERQPQWRAVRARAEAAECQLAVVQAQRQRDVSVGVQADRYPASATNPSGNGNTVSLSVTLPLFTSHAYEGEIARALAEHTLAQEALQLTRDAVWAEVRQAHTDWVGAYRRWRLADAELLPAAQRLADAASAAHARGGIALLDLLEARRALRAAQLEHLTAHAEAVKTAARWNTLNTDRP